MTYTRLETITLVLQAGGRPRFTAIWALLVALALLVSATTLDAQTSQVASVGLTPLERTNAARGRLVRGPEPT
jgi:hypothetical protein